MFSGFQPSGYQHSGYQIVEADEVVGGGKEWRGGYVHPYQQYQIEEYQRKTLAEKREDVQRLEQEIAQAEQAKHDKQAAEMLAAEDAMQELALIALQDEINRLRMERVWLMRLIDDEEAILALMLCLPLH